MKLATYRSETGPRIVGLRNGAYVDLAEADPDLPSCPKQFLAAGPEALRKAEKALASGRPLKDAPDLIVPIPSPEKIVCVGLNYADHAHETGAALPSCPVLFNKFLTALTPHGQPVVIPTLSSQVDFEGELVAIIGIGGRHIPRSRALDHVAGYCCGNDVSARDWQNGKPGGQWLAGKSFDTFAPCGPWLVTADEIPDIQNLKIESRLNGVVMQSSTTAAMIFPVAELVSYISDVCTLKPGDLIFTGTPPGVGVARKPPVFIKPGDVLEVEIERIGILRNPFIAE